MNITAAHFLAATGLAPGEYAPDDLERSNCRKAGTPGHWSCGWCWAWNKPRFLAFDCDCPHGTCLAREEG